MSLVKPDCFCKIQATPDREEALVQQDLFYSSERVKRLYIRNTRLYGVGKIAEAVGGRVTVMAVGSAPVAGFKADNHLSAIALNSTQPLPGASGKRRFAVPRSHSRYRRDQTRLSEYKSRLTVYYDKELIIPSTILYEAL